VSSMGVYDHQMHAVHACTCLFAHIDKQTIGNLVTNLSLEVHTLFAHTHKKLTHIQRERERER